MKAKLASAMLALAALSLAHPAFAEVCDKIVGDHWTSEHGPVSAFNPIGFPWGIALPLMLLAWAELSRSRRVAFGIAIVIGVLMIVGQVLPREIVHNGMTMHEMGVAEGCLKPDGPFDFVLPVITIAALIWIGLRHPVRKGSKA